MLHVVNVEPTLCCHTSILDNNISLILLYFICYKSSFLFVNPNKQNHSHTHEMCYFLGFMRIFYFIKTIDRVSVHHMSQSLSDALLFLQGCQVLCAMLHIKF